MTDKLFYSFEPLTQYFKQINKSVKEATMFKDKLAYWKEKISLLWTKPVEFVDNNEPVTPADYWSFEMYTHAWNNGDEIVPVKHNYIFDVNESTWMDALDQILDVMSHHYGYNIKEQVYYSVTFPLNEFDTQTGKAFAGYGRSLNDEMLQQLLLAYPEIYKAVPFGKKNKGIFEA